MIYSGISNWEQADAAITVSVPNKKPIEVLRGEFDTSKNQYAVCMIQVLEDHLQVEKLGTFHNNGLYENEEGRNVIEKR